jgi:hypothetical protein
VSAYHQPMPERLVVEVVAIEPLPLGANASRRAVVRWSDGSEGEALRWFDDEILFSEGDHGNSRLMSSGVRMRGMLGRSARGRAHNQ